MCHRYATGCSIVHIQNGTSQKKHFDFDEWDITRFTKNKKKEKKKEKRNYFKWDRMQRICFSFPVWSAMCLEHLHCYVIHLFPFRNDCKYEINKEKTAQNKKRMY